MPTTLGSSFLQPTLGALLIGILLSCILFGILTLQTYLYYMKFPEDRIQLKILVAFIWLLELAHCISIMHTIYDYAVIGYGDLQVFIRLPTSLSVAILFTAIIGPTVQIFYAERIRIVSGGKLIVPIFCWLMSSLHFSTTLVSSIKAIQMTSLVQYAEDWKWLLTTALSIGVSVDVIISASLCYFLSKLKTKSTVKRTAQAIDKIMVWTIQTGLLNSIASAATMICFLAIPNSFVWLAVFTCLAQLYSNSLLASLNSRAALREARMYATSIMALPGRDNASDMFPQDGSDPPNEPEMVIKMTQLTESITEDAEITVVPRFMY